MEKKVEQFIKKWEMITEEDVVVVGISGGADSMSLLVVLDELCKKISFQMVAVHVNHGIRGEDADRDEAYVSEICAKRQIPCEVYHINIKEYALKEKVSQEEAGRLVRRQAFEETMKKYGGTRIALAHHQEDNAETFFMNLARGSRLKGLGGISPASGVYIRPLLCVERKEIEEYLQKKQVAYCTDVTNLEDTYTRNRIRHHIIPYFQEKINVKTVAHINGSMEQLREVWQFLEDVTKQAVEEFTCAADEGILIQNNITAMQNLICGMVIRYVMTQVAHKEKDLEEVHVSSVKELFKKQTGKEVYLPYGMYAERVYEGVVVRKNKRKKKKIPAQCMLDLKSGKNAEIQYGKWKISYRIFQKEANMEIPIKKTYTKWFDYDIMKKNVVIRTRQAGDQITINKEGNSKKLKSYFIDEKISADKRDRIPLIAQGNEILWIVGYRQSKAYQVTEQTTTVIEITINGGDQNVRED